jgi:hypothetical protein
VPAVRLVEVLATLSLTTDLASGMVFEKGLRVCLVADGLAGRLGLDGATRSDVFTTALLRSIGCTAFAPENAAEFQDDVRFQGVLKRLDPSSPELLSRQLLLLEDPALADHFLQIAPTVHVAARIRIGITSPSGILVEDDEVHLWGIGPDGLVHSMKHYCDTAKQIASMGTSDAL